MAPGVDSLNVATAAAVALHHLARTPPENLRPPPPRQTRGTARVSHSLNLVARYPVRNQRWRCSDDPWVNDSGFTRPCTFSWMRSSPMAEAASRPSAMSAR